MTHDENIQLCTFFFLFFFFYTNECLKQYPLLLYVLAVHFKLHHEGATNFHQSTTEHGLFSQSYSICYRTKTFHKRAKMVEQYKHFWPHTCTKGLYTTAVTALATAFVCGLSQVFGLDVEMVCYIYG